MYGVNFDDSQNLTWFGRDHTDHQTVRISFNTVEKLKSPNSFLSLHYEKINCIIFPFFLWPVAVHKIIYTFK